MTKEEKKSISTVNSLETDVDVFGDIIKDRGVK